MLVFIYKDGSLALPGAEDSVSIECSVSQNSTRVHVLNWSYESLDQKPDAIQLYSRCINPTNTSQVKHVLIIIYSYSSLSCLLEINSCKT